MYCMHSGKKFVLATTVSSLIFGIATTAIASDSPATLAQTPQQKKPQGQATVVEDNSFKFQLQGCQRIGAKVTCSLLVTNLAEKDRQVIIWSSRSFDFSGNEYNFQSAQIGKSQSTGYSAASTVLLSSIPIKASVSFELPRPVTQLAAIEIKYNGANVDSKVIFRDVPITRSK